MSRNKTFMRNSPQGSSTSKSSTGKSTRQLPLRESPVRKSSRQPNPTTLEIFKNMFHSVAEEMGGALRRSAFSPNIKERRDYSCAVYDAAGGVLAMGDHMPVHLGSMPASVAAVSSALFLEPGDIAILNDPFSGGTHLPDLTMVMPIHLQNKKQPFFYVANRAHHADIGGAIAGSMGPAREIFEEGLRIPAVHIVRRGQLNRDVLSMILANVRTPAEREGDLAAQIASCRPASAVFLKSPKSMAKGNCTLTETSCSIIRKI